MMKSPKGKWNEGWTAGVIYAAGWLHSSHGDTMQAVEMLEHAGFSTRTSIEKSGAPEYDIELALDAWDSENGLGKYSMEESYPNPSAAQEGRE